MEQKLGLLGNPYKLRLIGQSGAYFFVASGQRTNQILYVMRMAARFVWILGPIECVALHVGLRLIGHRICSPGIPNWVFKSQVWLII